MCDMTHIHVWHDSHQSFIVLPLYPTLHSVGRPLKREQSLKQDLWIPSEEIFRREKSPRFFQKSPMNTGLFREIAFEREQSLEKALYSREWFAFLICKNAGLFREIECRALLRDCIVAWRACHASWALLGSFERIYGSFERLNAGLFGESPRDMRVTQQCNL